MSGGGLPEYYSSLTPWFFERRCAMKKKPQIKKLELSRETLRLLESEQLVRAKGGIDWTGCMSECTECGGVQFRDHN